jgi:ribonuclease HI
MTAVILEDTSTTGASALEAAAALTAEGVTVSRVISLIDRSEGAAENIAKAGLPFESIFSVSEIVAEAGDVAGGSAAKETAKPPGDTSAREAVPSRSARATPVANGKGARMVLQTDGASEGNPGPAGAAYVIFGQDGKELERGSKPLGSATNNVAEYQALLLGLSAATSKGASELVVKLDSELVVKQMLGQYRVKHPDLQPLHQQARRAASAFRRIQFLHVPREKNRIADRLASQAAAQSPKA